MAVKTESNLFKYSDKEFAIEYIYKENSSKLRQCIPSRIYTIF